MSKIRIWRWLDRPPISTPDATLNAIVNTLGLTGSYIFQYGTRITALAISTARRTWSASTIVVAASAPLTNLKPKTTYYFQVVVSADGGTSSEPFSASSPTE